GRGSRNGCEDWNASRRRLLYDLEAQAAADHQHSIAQRYPALNKRPTDGFVHCVVTTDVLVHGNEFLIRTGHRLHGVPDRMLASRGHDLTGAETDVRSWTKQGSSVKTSGSGEHLLCFAHDERQAQERGSGKL